MYFIIFRITRLTFLYLINHFFFFINKIKILEIDIERCVRDSIDIFATTPRSCTYREHASDISAYQINNDLV
jgi:hypothetical protein